MGAREGHADILSKIERCESSGNQFGPNGKVLRNKANKRVVGLFQINERIHGPTARRLGLNIYTAEGNRAYARYLLRTEGTAPWLASRGCWGSAVLRVHRHRVTLRRFASK